MALLVTELTDLGTPEAPHPAVRAAVDFAMAHDDTLFGHADYVDRASDWVAYHADQSRMRRRLSVVRDADAVVGLAEMTFPLLDNQHLAEWEIRAHPAQPVGAILDRLWDALAMRLDAEDRDVVVLWQTAPPAQPGDELLVPRTGAGRVPRTAVTDWLTQRGFSFEMVEVASRLQLPVDPGLLDRLENAALAASEAYELRQWIGPTPADLQEPMARLRSMMSTDPPQGELVLEAETWDAARVRAEDAHTEHVRQAGLWSVALERATGEAVAHTYVSCPRGIPEVAYQEDTLVQAGHRGHRLGMLVKVANLRLLAQACPRVRRLHTFNADENRWMLNINQALGFRPATTLGAWQWSR